MFLLDLYKFCENVDTFDRQQFARFVYAHKECDRLAKHAELTPRMFATSVSREFFGRMCTLGYLDLKNGVATCYGSHKRPFKFELYSLDGMRSDYIREMLSIGEMSDDELFEAKANRRELEILKRKFDLA